MRLRGKPWSLLAVLAFVACASNQSIIEAIQRDEAERRGLCAQRADQGPRRAEGRRGRQARQRRVPIEHAIEAGSVETARRLLALGSERPRLLFVACKEADDADLRRRRHELVRMLLARGMDTTGFHSQAHVSG